MSGLPEQLRARFIGGTYHKRIHGADPWSLASFRSTPRGMQILADVQRRKPRHWIALDDDIEDWPHAAICNLVVCEGTTGLFNLEVRQSLRRKLQNITQVNSCGKRAQLHGAADDTPVVEVHALMHEEPGNHGEARSRLSGQTPILDGKHQRLQRWMKHRCPCLRVLPNH